MSEVTPADLFGTEEPAPARRRLKAGPLTAVLEDGNLRDIRFDGVELVRAINYLARDEAWGTFRAEISDLRVTESKDGFAVDYTGLCGSPDAGFRYAMRIRGEASGQLTLEAEGTALADFRTNRIGFVVLHAAEAAGGRMGLEHTDGSREEAAFPRLVMADQPAFDIAAISHEAAPGLACTVEMTGDAFEMEDQRNWADASFKTYVRPLARPRPYTIAKGQRDRQQVVVRVSGAPAAVAASGEGARPITLGRPAGTMPRIALFVDEAGWGGLSPESTPALAIARLDLEAPNLAALKAPPGVELAVELVMPARDPDAEAGEALKLLRGAKPAALLVSPRREFRTRASSTLPDGEASTDALVKALRRAGFAGPIGAGTPSYFTEFNRNPPGKVADFIFFSVAAIVHAADDISVGETIDVYPTLVESARALLPGKPVWLGPCTIGVRHNPYGARPVPNPQGGRVPSATADPRQKALFGAAYAVGAAAQAARGGVETLTLGAPAGPFGIAGADGTPRPIAAVFAELKGAAGAPCRPLNGLPRGVHGVAYGDPARALVANLSAQDCTLDLPPELAQAALLMPDTSWRRAHPVARRLVLPAWRTALLGA